MTKSLGKKLFETGFWLVVLPALWSLAAWNQIQDWHRYQLQIDYFRYLTQEATSCIGALVMVIFVAWWLRRFQLTLDAWKSLIVAWFLGSVIFTIGHYSIYVILRILIYATQDLTYHWQAGFLYNLVHEYQRDLGPYTGIAVSMLVYRRFIAPQLFPEGEMETETASDDRLVVQTGRGSAVLRLDEIDYLEASRNYVTIHARDREYLVRETLSNLMQRLAAGSFERCHRSYLVNIEKVVEVRSQESGGHVIELTSGAQIPLGRSYREMFQASLLSS